MKMFKHSWFQVWFRTRRFRETVIDEYDSELVALLGSCVL